MYMLRACRMVGTLFFSGLPGSTVSQAAQLEGPGVVKRYSSGMPERGTRVQGRFELP